MNISFETKPLVIALNVKSFGPFIISSELTFRTHGMVDSGLKNGRLNTKSARMALSKMYRGTAKGEDLDPRDFYPFNNPQSYGNIPMWAVTSALVFHHHCLESRLTIRIPL